MPLFLLLLVSFVWGCASYTQETRQIRGLFRGGQYQQALKELESSSLKDEGRNRLLYHLEKAMILDRMGRLEASRNHLLKADQVAEKLYTVSLSKEAASLLYNEGLTDYAGEDYEKVAIHTQLALSFLEDGEFNAAVVEARKINTKLHEINADYEKKNRYGEDAFARYLAGVIHEARGAVDDAIIDYKKALDLYEGFYSRYAYGGVPENLVAALARLARQRGRQQLVDDLEKTYSAVLAKARRRREGLGRYGEVVVVHEAGHIATKETAEFAIGVGKQLVRFSFPVIRERGSSGYGKTGFRLGEKGDFVAADNVQDMDRIASDTLEDKRLRVIAKQSARLLAKGQLTEQAYRNFGPVAGLAANIYSVVTETADTRGWTLLPEAYFISRRPVRPGSHRVEIYTDGRLSHVKTVQVPPGEVKIVRATEG